MKKLIIAFLLIIFVSVVVISLVANHIDHPLPQGVIADKILIEKHDRRLTLFSKGVPIKSYIVSLGRDPKGKKIEAGDGRTPEGIYIIDRRKQNSRFHHALHISYPNAADIAQAKERGVSTGGDIMIHGLPNGLGFLGRLSFKRDWTLGCVAVTNPEIDEIWRAVPDMTIVEIVQ